MAFNSGEKTELGEAIHYGRNIILIVSKTYYILGFFSFKVSEIWYNTPIKAFLVGNGKNSVYSQRPKMDLNKK